MSILDVVAEFLKTLKLTISRRIRGLADGALPARFPDSDEFANNIYFVLYP